ncbi:Protein of unknown function, partial [Gryllus bimaculatus]
MRNGAAWRLTRQFKNAPTSRISPAGGACGWRVERGSPRELRPAPSMTERRTGAGVTNTGWTLAPRGPSPHRE